MFVSGVRLARHLTPSFSLAYMRGSKLALASLAICSCLCTEHPLAAPKLDRGPVRHATRRLASGLDRARSGPGIVDVLEGTGRAARGRRMFCLGPLPRRQLSAVDARRRGRSDRLQPATRRCRRRRRSSCNCPTGYPVYPGTGGSSLPVLCMPDTRTSVGPTIRSRPGTLLRPKRGPACCERRCTARRRHERHGSTAPR